MRDSHRAWSSADSAPFITSGAQGRFFEVTPDGDIVWDYWNPYSGTLEGNPVTRNTPYGVFRATKLSPDHPALAGRNLAAGRSSADVRGRVDQRSHPRHGI